MPSLSRTIDRIARQNEHEVCDNDYILLVEILHAGLGYLNITDFASHRQKNRSVSEFLDLADCGYVLI